MAFIPVNERQLALIVNVAGEFGVNIRHTNLEFDGEPSSEYGKALIEAVEAHADELLSVIASVCEAAEVAMNVAVTQAAAAGDESASKALSYWPDEQPAYSDGGYLRVCGHQLRGTPRVQRRTSQRKPAVKVAL